MDDPALYSTFVAGHSSLCMDVSGGDTTNGAGVVQQSCGPALSQQWRLEDTSAGYVHVIARHSSKCLNVQGKSTADGAAILQRQCTTGSNDDWKLEDAGNGYNRLVARHSGKCLDVSAGSTAQGAALVQWTCNGAGSQRFARSSPTTRLVTWGASTDKLAQPAAQNLTHRLIVHTSAGGSGLGIRLSNAFGDQPVTFGAAWVGQRSAGAAVTPGTNRPLTFGSLGSVTVPAGGSVYSDQLTGAVQPDSDLAVSLYVQQASGVLTGHNVASQTSYSAPAGDHAADESQTSYTDTSTSWAYLDALVVDAPVGTGAVATLGDSITDGFKSPTNLNHRWPDFLAARLRNSTDTLIKGVANEGITGNKVLIDGAGQSAISRLDRDVLTQPGLKTIVLLEGVNDINHTTTLTAQQLIDGYTDIVNRAHAAGVCVVGATVMPFEGGTQKWTPEKDALRNEVNAFIRTGGIFDAVVDTDAALRDPAHPSRLLPQYDNDHLHPNDAGRQAIADSISLDKLNCTR
ncbi:RICIN domain-containing protein [Streptomyces sp. BE20]|uniref:RICIN domain-containing protein n=1 Tax=unclassified Streptomyces TaxID=2593676 RepID=UPI002E78CF38|nr:MULTISPECIES: RICIN domain-containing protein [unclassified Streptomyces]MED7947569.1 RICIN domain-containing protein [Streptomyces sp. BE303]MEE1828067.1 RICIN domain-containing protein [Streptomyces sp. BE20]